MGSISEYYTQCNNSFDNLIATSKAPLRDYGKQLPLKGVVNEHGRFKVWAGSLGAKHPPHKRISLDYRLRDSEFYKIRIVDILQRLEHTLQKATQLLRNERQPFEEVSYDAEQLSDPESDDASSTSSTDNSTSDGLGQTPSSLQNPPDTVDSNEMSSTTGALGVARPARETGLEMPQLYEAIQSSVRHLYSMSMVIRRPVPIDRLSRASRIPVQHFRSFDKQHVEECFPDATKDLKKRVANAITRRRQLLIYNEEHHQRSSEVPLQEAVTQSYAPRPESERHNIDRHQVPMQNPAQRIMDSASSNIEGSAKASTEASKVLPYNESKAVDAQSESGTVSSFGFSEKGGERIRMPPRPQGDDGEAPDQFLCPFCYHLVEIKTSKAWTKHVFRDLQAYMCTFDDCADPDRMFETRDEWIHHEFEHHRREWHCNTPGHPICSSEDEFIGHMRRLHASQVPEDQLQSMSKLCERPALSGPVVCPLCTENQYDVHGGFVRFRSSSLVRGADEIALDETYLADVLMHHDQRFNELEEPAGWVMSLPEEYEWLPSSAIGDSERQHSPEHASRPVSKFILDPTKLKRHLSQHLERLALFAINRSKFMPDDQMSVPSGDAIPRSESSSMFSDDTETSDPSTGEASVTSKSRTILESLHYSAQNAREENIPMAYRETFKWIFDSATTPFQDWLEEGDGLFWIAGKAGSGKSTLMKFIATHARTVDALSEWASPQKHVIASHYFWKYGLPMERSLQGMLRTILYDILLRAPELVTALCPDRLVKSSSPEIRQNTWTTAELQDMMQKFISMEDAPIRCCIFIDALDEYDGDFTDITELVHMLARSRHCKICISSRPFNVFQDAFGRDRTRQLNIHELTRPDIESYVRGRIHDHSRWPSYQPHSGGAGSLVSKITERAEGVFLWAFLVTGRVCESLSDHDLYLDILRQIDSIPPDMELFFRHILDSVNPLYRKDMAESLFLALTAASPLHVAIYGCHYEYGDIEYANEPNKPLRWEQLSVQHRFDFMDTTSRRLNARCNGLLEVRQDSHVEFCHGTAHDFLMLSKMTELLQTYCKPNFLPNLSIFRASVVWIKRSSSQEHDVIQTEPIVDTQPGFGPVLKQALTEALKYVIASGMEDERETTAVLNELELSLGVMAATKQITISAHPKESADGRQAKRLFRELVHQLQLDRFL